MRIKIEVLKARASIELYNFKDSIPPWTSYCRACLRRIGLDPFETKACGLEVECEHYPFKYKYCPPKE